MSLEVNKCILIEEAIDLIPQWRIKKANLEKFPSNTVPRGKIAAFGITGVVLAILGAGGIMLSIVPLPSTINSLVSEWMHSFVVKVGGGLVVLTGILTGTIPIIAIPKKIKKSNKKILDFALDSSRYENIEYFAKLLDPGKAICVKETTPAVYYVIKKECIETHKTNPLDKNQTNLEFLNLEEIKSLPKKKS